MAVGQVQLEGAIVAGPAAVVEGGGFPNAVETIQLATTPSPKTYGRKEGKTIPLTGALTNFALDFAGISASFVYLRTDQPITIRVNGLAVDIPVHGLFVLETSATAPAALITAITVTVPASVTVNVEYFVSGP